MQNSRTFKVFKDPYEPWILKEFKSAIDKQQFTRHTHFLQKYTSVISYSQLFQFYFCLFLRKMVTLLTFILVKIPSRLNLFINSKTTKSTMKILNPCLVIICKEKILYTNSTKWPYVSTFIGVFKIIRFHSITGNWTLIII